MGQYLLQSLITLVALGLLLTLLVHGTRRSNVPGADMKLLGRLQLEGRRALYVVRVGQRVFVLAGSEYAMTKVAELSPTELPDTAAQHPAGFADVLQRILPRTPKQPKADEPVGGSEQQEQRREP